MGNNKLIDSDINNLFTNIQFLDCWQLQALGCINVRNWKKMFGCCGLWLWPGLRHMTPLWSTYAAMQMCSESRWHSEHWLTHLQSIWRRDLENWFAHQLTNNQATMSTSVWHAKLIHRMLYQWNNVFLPVHLEQSKNSISLLSDHILNFYNQNTCDFIVTATIVQKCYYDSTAYYYVKYQSTMIKLKRNTIKIIIGKLNA